MGRSLTVVRTFASVPGLLVIPFAIRSNDESTLVAWIESRPAESAARRHRLELWGTGAFVATSTGRRCGEIPRILHDLGVLLGIEQPDAISVSEYLPGQGVAMHVDRDEAGPTVIGVSLLGAGVLRFQRGDDRAIDIEYPRRAMMVMEGECRSLPWQHELLPVVERRMSIVFRRDGSAEPPTCTAY